MPKDACAASFIIKPKMIKLRLSNNLTFSLRPLTTIIIATALLCANDAQAASADSTRHWGVEVSAMAGKVLALDSYTKKFLQDDGCYSFAAELMHVALPQDSDAFAADFGYPALSLGVRYAVNNDVTMRRYADTDWGKLQPVDFDTKLGNTVSLYLNFRRAIVRTRRFEAGYTLATGVGYSHLKYNKNTSPDNEFIGSRWLIYFAASAYAQWRFADEWALKGAIDFFHHSNGALNRPNKGSNTVGPSLAVVYVPYYQDLVDGGKHRYNPPFKKYFYLNFTAGVGGKTLNEDWQLTQFQTDPSNPNYRTGRFHFYTTCSFQADCMYRYARRWASGIGADLFYGNYSDRVAAIDAANGSTAKHSPWSFGLAAKHQVFYHNLSLAMSLGFYLYRHVGENAKEVETPYYERIGLHYSIPSLGGLELGLNVKAHKTKADYTEFVIAVPVRL